MRPVWIGALARAWRERRSVGVPCLPRRHRFDRSNRRRLHTRDSDSEGIDGGCSINFRDRRDLDVATRSRAAKDAAQRNRAARVGHSRSADSRAQSRSATRGDHRHPRASGGRALTIRSAFPGTVEPGEGVGLVVHDLPGGPAIAALLVEWQSPDGATRVSKYFIQWLCLGAGYSPIPRTRPARIGTGLRTRTAPPAVTQSGERSIIHGR